MSAQWNHQRVTIGLTPPDELRRLSNARLLTCPGCGSPVILHAGSVRAHHFAHLPGAVCSAPQTEPETEEHRAGKLLLAQWLRACLPDADIVVEAHIPETNQRADILVVLSPHQPRLNFNAQTFPVRDPATSAVNTPSTANAPHVQDRTNGRVVAPAVTKSQRIAIEYQCANMPAKEWRRRHQLYRNAGIQDLWLLGGSRLLREAPPAANSDTNENPNVNANRAANIKQDIGNTPAANTPVAPALPSTILRTHELERGLLWDGAPLLFLDAIGEQIAIGSLARFRPHPDAQAMRPEGRLVTRALLDLPFPFALLDWPSALHPEEPLQGTGNREQGTGKTNHQSPATNHQLWHWLAQRHRVTPDTLDSFFGLPIKNADVFACENRAWQAALYYRFIHRRVGDRWWLGEVETWTRAYLPLTFPVHLKRLQYALAEYQELLAAGGMLSLPRGYNRVNAIVTADLTTLPEPPDPQEVLRLARYRRTLAREATADYAAK